MRRLVTLPAVLALLAAACGGTSGGAVVKAKGLELVRIGTFSDPVYVAAPPGDRDRLFVVEQAGRILVLDHGRRRTFLDIRKLVTSGGEQGLLSMAFAPDYATSKRFYVYYTGRSGNQRVVEYRAAGPDRADPGSARLVLQMADQESNHNGGLLLFGPDGKLYIGTGDGGGAGDRHGAHGNAQNLHSLLGKILRMDPAVHGARPEIYSYGLRNPWRFTFDAQTDDLVIGDVGQDEVEEIDYVDDGKGVNFGWRVFEGDRRYQRGESAPGAVGPVMTFRHADGNCSITGGVVVRDRAVPAAYGRYLFGDYCKGEILAARLARPRSVAHRTGLKVASLSSFGTDARGRVYVVSLNGPVYRLAAR
jgi:glucose/arabinose dehydrogenase